MGQRCVGYTRGAARARRVYAVAANGQEEEWRGTGRATPSAPHDMSYYAYLRSPAWKGKRAVARKRARGKCRVCGTTDNLHTHHKTYKNLGAERQHQLVVLCADHHKGCHAFIAEWKRKGWKPKSDYTLTMKYIARERKKRKVKK